MRYQSKGNSILGPVFLGVFLLFTSVFGAVCYWLWEDAREDRFSDLASTLTVIKRYYELSFKQYELTLSAVGKRVNEIEGQDAIRRKWDYARTVKDSYESLLAIGFVDTTGQIVVFTEAEPGDSLPNLAISEDSRRSFMLTKERSGLTLGEVYFFQEVNDWILPLRVPIRDEEGKLIAVNTSAIEYMSLIRELQKFGVQQEYTIHLRNNTFGTNQLFHPIRRGENGDRIGHSRELYELFSSEARYAGNDVYRARYVGDSEDVLAMKASLEGLDHDLIVSFPSKAIFGDFWTNTRFIFLTYIILSFVMLFFYRYSGRREQSYFQYLREERDFSTYIIERSPSLILGISKQDKITFCNPSAANVIGASIDEIIGEDWRALLKDRASDQQMEALQDNYQNSDSSEVVINIKGKKGESKVLSLRVFRQVTGKTANETLVFGQDITDRVGAERKVREREANLQALFENTSSIIGLFDRDLRLVEFNQSFIKYAKEADNIELKPGMDVLSEMEPGIAEVFRGFLGMALQGEKINKTVPYPAPAGTLYFMFNYNPIINDGEIIGVSMFVQDITELKQTQQELEEYTEKLELMVADRTRELDNRNLELSQRNEKLAEALQSLKETQQQLIQAEKMASLGILTAGIGHEINNPLNFIKNGTLGLVKVIHDSDKTLKEKTEPFLKIIDDGVNRAARIVKSLSHLSRKGEKLDEVCNIPEIIDNCLTILHNQIKTGVEVNRIYPDNLATVSGSESKLHQVFLNILSNALHAMEGSGRIDVEVQQIDEKLHVSFSDTGQGISDEHLSKISDPFFTTKPPGEGTGLGLFISYAIVEEHSGRINVKSQKNKGTKFTVILPVNPVTNA
jgi:PAS domain S-box-containing protein